MKILVFENQLSTVQPSFSCVNAAFFNDTLVIDYLQKSQDLKPFKKIEEYEYVFIDISLAPNSSLDGIGILKKINEEKLKVINPIILTGDSRIKEKLEKNGIFNIPVLYKPIDFMELKEIMSKNN